MAYVEAMGKSSQVEMDTWCCIKTLGWWVFTAAENLESAQKTQMFHELLYRIRKQLEKYYISIKIINYTKLA